MANPRHTCGCLISREDARRVDALAVQVGDRRAAELLGIGPAKLEEARDEGKMLKSTRARILEALDRIDREGLE